MRVFMTNSFYVYILASKRNGTLYIGVTNDLIRRIYEHKEGIVEGFTNRYGVHKLVYFEQTNDINSALLREKQLKKWNRRWKIELIEGFNPDWKDLTKDWIPTYVGMTEVRLDSHPRSLSRTCLRGNDRVG
jgi:putative endonuclease